MDYEIEHQLNEFLKNLLNEEGSISLEYYSKTYNLPLKSAMDLYSLVLHSKKGFLANQHAFFSIRLGMKPIVRQFLDDGGFVKEKEKENFENELKVANYELTTKQIKEIKITRNIAVVSVIVSVIAMVISVITIYSK